MPTLDIEARATQQRDFYLKLVPNGGAYVAAQLGGFTPPGADGQEADARDALVLWMKMHHSGASPVVMDTAWWMTQFMDQQRRLSMNESAERTSELFSFAVATMGQLMDKGIIKFVKEPELPTKIVTSTHDPINEDITAALLKRMEAGLGKDAPKDE